MKSEAYKRKVDTPDEFLARNLCAAVSIKEDEKLGFFAHELQSALRLTVGFSNIHCEP
jgi:hypothetical protein